MEDFFWQSLHGDLLRESGPNRGLSFTNHRTVHFHFKYFLKSERLRNWALHLHICVPAQHNICLTHLETLWCCFHFLPTTTTLFSFLIVGFGNCFSEGRGGIEEHFNTWEKEAFRGKRQSTYSQDQLEPENTTERDTNWEKILYLLFICSHNRWVLAWLKFSMK